MPSQPPGFPLSRVPAGSPLPRCWRAILLNLPISRIGLSRVSQLSFRPHPNSISDSSICSSHSPAFLTFQFPGLASSDHPKFPSDHTQTQLQTLPGSFLISNFIYLPISRAAPSPNLPKFPPDSIPNPSLAPSISHSQSPTFLTFQIPGLASPNLLSFLSDHIQTHFQTLSLIIPKPQLS